MRILKKISQSRRDFIAIYICEHCKKEEQGNGYDDTFFHSEVIPKMKCKSCGKIASKNYELMKTKYPDNLQV